MAKANKNEKKLTPLMEQYWGVKSAHPDKILFFRMGDFFEIFSDDAETAAPILGIALTVRNKKSGDHTKMCGMPHHSIAGAVTKLLNAGFKVAICDQLEDPKSAKGLVKRGVTRILSPGMVFDPETLDAGKANYIACEAKEQFSFLDTSTGECFYYENLSEKQKQSLLNILSPAELLLSEDDYEKRLAKKSSVSGPHLSKFPSVESFVDLSQYSDVFNQNLPEGLELLFQYAFSLAGESVLGLIKTISKRNYQKYMALSPGSMEHLEIFLDSRSQLTGSLFHKINRCKTAIGSRKLRHFLSFPLVEKEEIEKRYDKLGYWMAESFKRTSIRERLNVIGDPERRLAKVLGPGASPRDLRSLESSLRRCIELLPDTDFSKDATELLALVDLVDSAIIEEAPVSLSKGFFIQKNFNEKLDEYIELSDNANDLLRKMEAEEKAKHEIPSLKIRYNGVFGYYIEVTKTHQAKVPDHYQRKQTLVNSERYTTEELKELERKILSAKSKRDSLELEIFNDLKNAFRDSSALILEISEEIAKLDVFTAFAELSEDRSYIRPELSQAEGIDIKASKHPILEQDLGVSFVENDLFLKPGSSILLTGPNMAGKSTLMKQVALLHIMAQAGCFVPAKTAKMMIFEQVFTRIGASDSLSEGMSTFMVEMTETSEILNGLCDNSLVLMDEVGRGTSTYDGMSLAQAILEYLMENSKAHIIFSTHYHELTELSASFPNLENRHMAIRENAGKVHFLHQMAMGPANKSYGIHVAKLAGLPTKLTKRAERILKELELQNDGQYSLMAFAETETLEDASQNTEEADELRKQLQEIRNLKIQEMTPLELMTTIGKWQNQYS